MSCRVVRLCHKLQHKFHDWLYHFAVALRYLFTFLDGLSFRCAKLQAIPLICFRPFPLAHSHLPIAFFSCILAQVVNQIPHFSVKKQQQHSSAQVCFERWWKITPRVCDKRDAMERNILTFEFWVMPVDELRLQTWKFQKNLINSHPRRPVFRQIRLIVWHS